MVLNFVPPLFLLSSSKYLTNRWFAFLFFSFKGGDVPPSNVQLCGNKRLVIGFSDEAFAALKTVSESDHPSIDVHCLSKNLLDHQIVTSDLKAHPLEQSFLIHILAR